MANRVRNKSDYKSSTLYSTGPFPPLYREETRSVGVDTRDTLYEYMEDVNNKRARPESPCTHVKGVLDLKPFGPSSVPVAEFNLNGGFPLVGANILHTYLNALVSERVNEAFAGIKSRAYAQYAQMNDRYSSINFFAELGDVGTIFKSLKKYQYVDWSFGIQPMIGDISTALTALDDWTERTNRFLAQLRNPKNVTGSMNLAIPVGGRLTTGQYQHIDITSTVIIVRCRYKFGLRVITPTLINDNLLRDRLLLDAQGFHPDLTTVYEAIPFSWLVDWVVPFGDYLQHISHNWFEPAVVLHGSFSVKAQTTLRFKAFHLYGDRYRASDESTYSWTYYKRSPLSTTFGPKEFDSPVMKVPQPSLHKFALLFDIFGPGASVEKTENTYRKARRKAKRLKKRAMRRLSRGRK